MKRILMLVVVAGIAATACASPNTAGVNPSGSPAVSSGVRGIVELGPTCPVERADSPCPPKLLATSVTVISTTTKFSVSSRSDERGHFSIPLPPGTYSVTAGANGSVQRSQVVTVTVHAGAFVSVTLMVDSGIRLPGRVTP